MGKNQRSSRKAGEPRSWRVGEVARHFGVAPRVIADLFWNGRLDGALCPITRGRRVIPDAYLAEIERVLIEVGALGPNGKPLKVDVQAS